MTTLIQSKVIENEKTKLFKISAICLVLLVYFSLEITLLRAAGHLENFPSCCTRQHIPTPVNEGRYPEVHPGKDKDEIGLQHDEHDGGHDVGGLDGAEAVRVRRELEENDELEGEVGDGAHPEDDGPHSHRQAAVTLKCGQA